MASTIKIRNSSTTGSAPSSLVQGELAIIVADGNITMDGKTINLNSGTKGAARLDDTVDTGDDPAGISGSDGSNKIESASQTVFIGD